MTITPATANLTELLLMASVHHLRVTTEPLPVGQITLNRDGYIQSIDRFTEAVLNLEGAEVKGKHLSHILADCSRELIEMLKDDYFDKPIPISFGLPGRHSVQAMLVLVNSLAPCAYALSIIYTTIE